jgi:hypothetical protein
MALYMFFLDLIMKREIMSLAFDERANMSLEFDKSAETMAVTCEIGDVFHTRYNAVLGAKNFVEKFKASLVANPTEKIHFEFNKSQQMSIQMYEMELMQSTEAYHAFLQQCQEIITREVARWSACEDEGERWSALEDWNDLKAEIEHKNEMMITGQVLEE